MSKSKYTPESYLDKSLVNDDNDLYFVKKDGSTSAKGVTVCDYNTLKNVDIRNCVIQKSMKNPDLYLNKRYKIRQLVFLHNKNCYVHRDSWTSISSVDYVSNSKLRDKHVIYQKGDTKFILSNKLNKFNIIFKNIIKSVIDFTKYYHDEIEKIEKNEFVILGFDYVVDDNKNVHIIEINHRSNYAHPKHVSDICDVGGIKDIITLMITNNIMKTNLIKV